MSPAWPASFSPPLRSLSITAPLPAGPLVARWCGRRASGRRPTLSTSRSSVSARRSLPLVCRSDAPTMILSVPSGSSFLSSGHAFSPLLGFNPSRAASFRRAEAKVARADAAPYRPPAAAFRLRLAQRRNAMTAIVDVHARQILDSRGNPDGRGRRDAGGRQHGPRGGAVGRLDRRARSGRAARRRQEPLGRQGRRAGGARGQRRDRRGDRRPRGRGPGRRSTRR